MVMGLRVVGGGGLRGWFWGVGEVAGAGAGVACVGARGGGGDDVVVCCVILLCVVMRWWGKWGWWGGGLWM